jgi:oxygen-independent coproporphyrinogen-3 oxidase
LEVSSALLSFSLYVHVPFCVAKCGYCSFYSIPFDEAASEAWLCGVSREAGRLAETWADRIPLRTVYIGGGTPSVLSVSTWERLYSALDKAFDLSGVEEFTVEANPCSLTVEHLSLWRDLPSPVTRVSLGAQSLNDDSLTWLGRRHDAKTALAALEKTVSFGFDASADLLFGLPSQTLHDWRDSLRSVLAAGAGHVSTYQLTLEPGTPLGKTAPPLGDGYRFYRFAQWYLKRKGLEQYEIASFAPPGQECRHNMAYWRQENVLALGPSAWGYLDGFRYRNAQTLKEYSALTKAGVPIVEAERLEGRSRGVEAAILALRTRWGVDLTSFAMRFGEPLARDVHDALKKIPRRLTRFENSSVSLTSAGMRVGNAIWAELLDSGR